MDWTTPEGLKRLKEMAERATPGPWTPMLRPAPDYEDHGWRCLAGIWGGWMVAVPKEQIPSLREADESNTLLIAAAREALPQLIKALEKEQKTVEETVARVLRDPQVLDAARALLESWRRR